MEVLILNMNIYIYNKVTKSLTHKYVKNKIKTLLTKLIVFSNLMYIVFDIFFNLFKFFVIKN